MDPTEATQTPARRAVRWRSDFVAAFVEHAGSKPASDRLSVRLPTLITVTAVCVLLSLVVGIFWQLISPRSKAGAADPGYVATAGWGCDTTSDRGFDVQGRTDQWRTVADGGWSEGGCRGTFQTLPISNDADQSVQWWFVPSTGGQCRVEVYVPRDPSGAGSWVTSVRYEVLAGRGGAAYAEFEMNQAQNTGRWVDVGAFPLRTSELAVRVTARAAGEADARLAVSAVRATCGR
ncbi:hypothetical protein [Micromonospora sp. NPDC003241]